MNSKKFWVISIIIVIGIIIFIYNNTKKSTDESTQKIVPGAQQFSVEHESVTRTWDIYIPSSYSPNTKTPLVVVFHGGGGSSVAISYESQMNTVAEKNGFIVVYPNATEAVHKWNTGPRENMERDGSTADDTGFVKKMLADITSRFSIDENRIYATGFSNGGMFAFRMACEMTDVFAAIAPVGTRLMNYPCTPSRPISILFFQGTADPMLPYEGGPSYDSIPKVIRLQDDFMSAQETVNFWLEKNNITTDPTITYKRGDTVCETYTAQTTDATEVTFCTITDGGHTWPGGTYGNFKKKSVENIYANLVGKISHDVSASDMMWEFFTRHPRK